MDPRLAGQYSVKGAKQLALLALHCISLNPKDRPRMPFVIETLESLQQLKDMAVSYGQWPATTQKENRNAKGITMERKASNQRKSSLVTPTKKT